MALASLRLSVVHDYMSQTGGAERVAISLARQFSGGVLHTSWSLPDGAPEDAGTIDVRVSKLQPFAERTKDPRVLAPFLPSTFSSWKLEGDLAIASSSGWAHGVAQRNPTIVYCHTPARWLYVRGGKGGRFAVGHRLAAASSQLLLKGWDHKAARCAIGYIANSTNIRDRIWRVYGIDSPVVAPPLIPLKVPQRPAGAPSRPFVLLVARARSYKNVGVAVEALALSKLDAALVLVGQGTEVYTDEGAGVIGMGRVSDEELSWLYRRSRALLAVGNEDYGLTPIEATSVGTPTVAVPRGGYLETVVPGLNGILAESSEPGDLSDALRECLQQQWEVRSMIAHAHAFSEERFGQRLQREVEAMLD